MGVVGFEWVMCACCGGVVGGNENFMRKILGMVEEGIIWVCNKKVT